VRQAECHESEDHAGALCEIMALISQKQNEVPLETQARFFQEHIAPWMMTFFKDLQSAKNAKFYRVVGSLGRCFLESEREYLKHEAYDEFTTKKGGAQNENRIFRQPEDIS
jgi:TorA maturation chaperone TorD